MLASCPSWAALSLWLCPQDPSRARFGGSNVSIAVWPPGHRTLQGCCPLPLPGAGDGPWVGGRAHPSPSDPAVDNALGLSAFCCSVLRAGAPALQPRQCRGTSAGLLVALLQPHPTKASPNAAVKALGLRLRSGHVHAFQLCPWGDGPGRSLQPDFLSFQLKASSESENESPKRRGQKQMKKTWVSGKGVLSSDTLFSFLLFYCFILFFRIVVIVWQALSNWKACKIK